jgi:hypothetical protein
MTGHEKPADGASRSIIISDREHGLPYSKGLMANTIMAAGLTPARAYHVAHVIEERLLESERDSVTTEELRRIAEETIRREAGERYARSFLRWQTVSELDTPLPSTPTGLSRSSWRRRMTRSSSGSASRCRPSRSG